MGFIIVGYFQHRSNFTQGINDLNENTIFKSYNSEDLNRYINEVMFNASILSQLCQSTWESL